MKYLIAGFSFVGVPVKLTQSYPPLVFRAPTYTFFSRPIFFRCRWCPPTGGYEADVDVDAEMGVDVDGGRETGVDGTDADAGAGLMSDDQRAGLKKVQEVPLDVDRRFCLL